MDHTHFSYFPERVQQVEKKVIKKEKVQKETFELLNGEKILESSESSDEETITIFKDRVSIVFIWGNCIDIIFD